MGANMIDLEHESLLTLNEARRLPWLKSRRGNAVSLCTLNRWRSRGVGGVVLETAKIGGTVVTSTEAVLRFVERLSPSAVSHRTLTPSQRASAVSAGEKRLDQAGVE